MTKYYQVPFGSSGSRTAVPNPTQLDGTVNYTDGYGADYSLPLDTDPAALAPERDKWNQLLYDITLNIQQYQQHGFPEFITSADNGGSAFPYALGATCRYNNGVTILNYISLSDANTALPTNTSFWAVFDGVNITGNAATATKLQTARTIGGVSFDGTAAIVPQTIQSVDDTTDTTCFVGFFNASGSQSQQPKTNSSLTFNASTGALGATSFVGPLTGNASTATALQTTRAIGGVNFDGTAAITPQQIQPASEVSDATCFVGFFNSASATAQQPKYNAGFTYDSTTNTVTATTFVGAVTGNASTATALQTARNIGGVAFDGTAAITPTNITPASEAADTTCFIAFFNAASATAQQPKYNSSLTFDASTGSLGATTFVGALTGNVTGNASGSSGSCTGNAATATALQNARTIGGVNFDGTANIVPQTIASVDDTTDTTCFVAFFNASGTTSQQPKTNTSLTFNASTGALGATSFVGPLTGNVTGNTSGSSGSCTGNAATVTTISGLITAGTNVTITGSGTSGSPYSIAATGGGGSGTVTTTGTPASGNLTKFSGTTSIVNGDLSGDVTTSGTLVTTIKSSIALPGSPTTTTQAAGDNSTKIATTAYADAVGTGKAATSQIFMINAYIQTPSNATYLIATNVPYGFVINAVTGISTSGTCTLTTKIGTTALGGSAVSVTSVTSTQNASAPATVASGNDINLTVSANSSCSGLAVTIKCTRTLA